MIESRAELRAAFRHLQVMERALYALKSQLQNANPDLLVVTAPAYVNRIQELQKDIADYIYAHPAEVSALLPEAGESLESTAALA